MAHNARCERAEHPGCSCPCGGVDHGFDALNIAAGPRPHLIELRAQASSTYGSVVAAAATARKQSGRATTQQRKIDQALCRWAVSDVILYLNDHQDFLAVTRSVADSLSASVRDVFEDQFSVGQRKTLPQGHFWCALLAALAEALDRFEGEWKKVSHQVRDIVVQRLCSKPFVKKGVLTWLEDELIRTTVHLLWKSIDSAAAKCAGIDQFRKSIRILSILVCPDVSRHPEVIRWCLIPIYEEVLSQELQDLFLTWIRDRHPDFGR